MAKRWPPLRRVTKDRVSVDTSVRRGEIIGKRAGGEPTGEPGNFIRCPECGGLIDLRDLDQMLEHAGPLPHPTQDSAQ